MIVLLVYWARKRWAEEVITEVAEETAEEVMEGTGISTSHQKLTRKGS